MQSTVWSNRLWACAVVATGAMAAGCASETAPGPARRALVNQGEVAHLNQAALEELVREARASSAEEIPALAAAVVGGDGLELVAAAGVRRSGDPTAVTAADQFHLGSCTKSMTGTLIAIAVEKGLLDWEQTLGELLPDVELHSAFRPVTLRQILAHWAGVPANLDRETALALAARGDEDPKALRGWILTQVLGAAPVTPPGTAHEYSNVGYMIAGHLLERATGESWESLMQGWLFQPLGMASCGFGPPGQLAGDDQPWGHFDAGESLIPLEPVAYPDERYPDNAPYLGPAGTARCSLADWAKYARLHLRGLQGYDGLLRAESVAVLHQPWRPAESPYAAGWVEWMASTGHPASWHNGSNSFWYAEIELVPELDLAVLVTTNRDPAVEPVVRELREELARRGARR